MGDRSVECGTFIAIIEPIMLDSKTKRLKEISPRSGVLLVTLVMMLAVVPTATAVTIIEWDLANATGQTAGVLWADANLVGTAITASPGLTPWSSTAQDGFIAASGWSVAAPDPASYYEWSITAAPGFVVSYESVTLALFRGVQGANHGAELWDLRASTDGFVASDLFLQTFNIAASNADEQTVFAGADISTIGSAGGTVTLRLYGYDYTAATDFSGLGNDSGWLIGGVGANPIIEGVVILVPEPSTGLFLLMGLVGLAFCGRRRS